MRFSNEVIRKGDIYTKSKAQEWNAQTKSLGCGIIKN